MKLRWNYLLAIWGTTLLPLVVAGYFVFRTSEKRTEAQAGESLRLLTRLIGTEVDQYLGNLKDRVRARAMNSGIALYAEPGRQADTTGLDQLLLSVHNIDPVNVSSVALFDALGRKLADSDAVLSSVNESESRWVIQTLQDGANAIVAEANTAKPSIWLTTPLHGRDGRMGAFIRVRVQLSALQQIVGRATSDLTTFALIADGNGVILAHGKNSDTIGKGLLARFPDTEGSPRLAPSDTKVLPEETAGSRHAYVALEQAPWTVAVFQSEPAFHSGTREVLRVLLVLAAVAFLLGGGAALLAAHLLARPITRLAEVAKAIEDGSGDAQFPRAGPDELASLADAFNRMTTRLQNSFHELELQISETRENEKRLRDVINANPVALAVADEDGFLVRLNPAFGMLLGYTLAEVPTVQDLWLRLFPEGANHERFRDHLSEQLRGEGSTGAPTTAIEGEIVARDGSRKVAEIRARTFGPMLIVAFHDLTARRRAELEVVRLNVDLEHRVNARTLELTQANAELEAFSYAVSHDLRAPLRAIDGFSRALQEDYTAKLEGDGLDYLARIRAASQRMGVLIDDLLMLSKVSRAEVHRENFDLADTARQVWDALQQAEPERRVEFQCNGPMPVEGDLSLIRIVMENLLSNAWKYTRKSAGARVSFTERRQPAPDGRDERVFVVEDNGAGFDMRYATKLFGAFQRLHAQSEFEGSGIGLATVRRIINRHGGRIWAQAEVNRGAQFSFTLAEPRASGNPTDSHAPFTPNTPRSWH
ncbi:ATP-binding protein [Nibricoccus sp. IMCC34717]|uniref:sensor histidine kinase n=1 Tax=Nibricoccus sp. IMCC34717 TaxID=3034021 RepID=UPI00384D940C